MTKHVRVDIADRIATVTIDRPKVNALNMQVLRELHECFAGLEVHADEPDGPLAIVLTGAGKHFVAGADIAELAGLSPLQAREFARAGHRAMAAIEQHRLPVVAAVNGTALGGGCELMLACDLRVATRGAKMGQPEVTLGIPPGFGATQRLVRLVGPGAASELVLLGEPIDAEKAFDMGLVNRVVDDGLALEQATAWARRLATNAPVAVRLARAGLQRAMDVALEAGLDYETELFSQAFGTRDQKEGMNAFLERRDAHYNGS